MNQLTFLIGRYYQLQKHRVAMSNQLYQLKAGDENYEYVEKFYNDIYQIEKEIYKFISKEVKQEEIWNEFLKDVKGIGPALAASLIAIIDVHKTKHVSSLWKYAGLSPDSKRVKGQKIDWNPFLKNTCYKIGKAFVKTNGEYREIYDQAKKQYKKKFPEKIVDEKGRTRYNPGHIDMMAMRYAVKMFLKNLWLEWRMQKGLSMTEPYVIDKLGHDKQPKAVESKQPTYQ